MAHQKHDAGFRKRMARERLRVAGLERKQARRRARGEGDDGTNAARLRAREDGRWDRA